MTAVEIVAAIVKTAAVEADRPQSDGLFSAI